MTGIRVVTVPTACAVPAKPKAARGAANINAIFFIVPFMVLHTSFTYCHYLVIGLLPPENNLNKFTSFIIKLVKKKLTPIAQVYSMICQSLAHLYKNSICFL